MSVAYAPRGIIGVMTPEANTTVEPEMGILCPPGFAALNARMTSPKPDQNDRLVDYFNGMADWVRAFSNAPVTAFAFACTGSSYLVGPQRDREMRARLTAARGVPVVTAASAVVDALTALEAKRIGLLSPYPETLTAASAKHWEAHGFAIGRIEMAPVPKDAFHPIYAVSPEAVAETLARFEGDDLDAILLLGTGMPTLRPIHASPWVGRAAVLSSNLALAWRALRAAEGLPPDRASLVEWIEGKGWAARLP